MRRIKKFILLLLSFILLSAVLVCYFFGDSIRDALSARVDVTLMDMHSFDGELSALAVPLSCVRRDAEGEYILTAELEGTGKNAEYRVKRIEIKVSRQDDKCAEIKGFAEFDTYIILRSDRAVDEGDRVIIGAVKNVE